MDVDQPQKQRSPDEIKKLKAEHSEYVQRFDATLGKVRPDQFRTRFQARELEDPAWERLLKRLTLSSVLDACCVLDILRGCLRGTPSTFWDLVRAGTITCWAPPGLERDLKGKFDMLASQLSLPISTVEDAWRLQVAQHIHIAAGQESAEVSAAIRCLADRDPHDIEYPLLTVVLGADALLTKDRDLLSNPTVTTTSFGEMIRVARTHERGRIALHLQFRTAETLSIVFAIGFGASKELLGALRAIPLKVWLGIGAGVGCIMICDPLRNWLVRKVQPFRARLWNAWQSFVDEAANAWKNAQPVFEDLFRASNELAEVTDAYPRRPRKPARLSNTFRSTVLSVVGATKNGMTADEVLGALYPQLKHCKVDVLRGQIYRILSSHPDLERHGKGRYRLLRTRKRKASEQAAAE
jgi:hypothetical protein